MPTYKEDLQIKKAGELLLEYSKVYQQKATLVESHQAAVAPLDAQLTLLKAKLEDHSRKCNSIFGGAKTMKLEGGTFGFKLGTKSVAFPLGNLSATTEEAKAEADALRAKYLKIVKAELPEAIVESVDSKAVVGAWTMFPKMVKKLLKLGVSVKQEDSFFITPKK
jgi:multidrug efflux pump subunit AcrA (membrane-fusion protein)